VGVAGLVDVADVSVHVLWCDTSVLT